MTSNAQTTEETPKSSSSIAPMSLENVETDSSITKERPPASASPFLKPKMEEIGKVRKRRENVNDKGERYLREGRLRVVRVDGNLIVAKCRGGGVIYDLGFDPKLRQYRCTCPARGPCAHLIALQRVTAVER